MTVHIRHPDLERREAVLVHPSFTDILRSPTSVADINVSCQNNTHRKTDRRSRPGGIPQPCILPIWDFLTLGPPLVIQPNQGRNKFTYAQTVANQSDVNILPLFLHGIPNDGNHEILDRPSGPIPQVVEALSLGVFRVSSVKKREYTFRPVLLIRKFRVTLESPLVSFRDTEVLFLEKWGRNQLRAGRFGLG